MNTQECGWPPRAHSLNIQWHRKSFHRNRRDFVALYYHNPDWCGLYGLLNHAEDFMRAQEWAYASVKTQIQYICVIHIHTHAFVRDTHHLHVRSAIYLENIPPVLLCVPVRNKFLKLQHTHIHPYFLLTFTSLHSLQRLEFSTHFCRAIRKGTSMFTYLLSINDASLHKSLGKLMRFYLT